MSVITFLTKEAGNNTMTLIFRSTECATTSDVYLRIAPDTMTLAILGAAEETVKNLLDGFKTCLMSADQYIPYSDADITDFPFDVIHKLGDPAARCRREVLAHERRPGPDISVGRVCLSRPPPRSRS